MNLRILVLAAMMLVMAMWQSATQAADDSTLVSVGVAPVNGGVVRQTPTGNEQLVYLALDNPTAQAISSPALSYQIGHTPHTRSLLDIPPGGAWDTLWLPAGWHGPLEARLVQDSKTLWHGTLKIARPTGGRVFIPRSPAVKAAALRPLTLRGVNYFPRLTPWPGLWTDATKAVFDAEFTEIQKLNANMLRTFLFGYDKPELQRPDGTFLPNYLSRINILMAAADRHDLKVILCIRSGAEKPDTDFDYWKRYVRTSVEPFAYEGRIVMWDLINEPGGAAGPASTPELGHWLQTMYPFLKSADPEHLATVGLTWQFDQLWGLGVKPDVGQYHNYSGAVGLAPPGHPEVRNVADDLRGIVRGYTQSRPLLIGEFGFDSGPGQDQTPETLAHQEDIYRGVLQGAETARIAGVCNWCAFQFIPDWMGKKEQTFGVIRPDGSLKPAGILLRDTYKRWREQAPADWEIPPSPEKSHKG